MTLTSVPRFMTRKDLFAQLIGDKNFRCLRPQGKIVAIDRENSHYFNMEHEGTMIRKRISKSKPGYR